MIVFWFRDSDFIEFKNRILPTILQTYQRTTPLCIIHSKAKKNYGRIFGHECAASTPAKFKRQLSKMLHCELRHLWNLKNDISSLKIWSLISEFLVYLSIEMSVASENKCFAIHHCWAGKVSTCLFINYVTFSNQFSISSKYVLMSLGNEKKIFWFILGNFPFTKISCKTINARTFRNLIKFQSLKSSTLVDEKLLVFLWNRPEFHL